MVGIYYIYISTYFLNTFSRSKKIDSTKRKTTTRTSRFYHNTMTTIYVLLCERNRYYVGKTNRSLKKRVLEHFAGDGSEWTRRYKPIKLVEKIENADVFDEDKYTKIYMKKYGIDHVRGGAYTQFELPASTRMFLEREINGASDVCYRCHRPGHYVKQCYARTTIDGLPISDDDESSEEEYSDSEEECWYCERCGKEFESYREANKHEKNKCKFYKKNTCYRCGRAGHNVDGCYANHHISGKSLDD